MSTVEQTLRRALRQHDYAQEALLLRAQHTDGLDDLADWSQRHFAMPD